MKILYTHSVFIIIASLCIFLSSCEKRRIEKAKQVVTQFHQAYKSEDLQDILKLYPNIVNLKGNYFKSDEFVVKGGCVLPSKNILIVGENIWTNGFGKENKRLMKFFVQEIEEKGKKVYKIIDSKNFASFEDDKYYTIALKTGAINRLVDTTDMSVSRKITIIQPKVKEFEQNIKQNIIDNVEIKNNNWSVSDYCDYASGRSLCVNNSIFPIKNPKVRLEFRASRNGAVIATSEETICYGWLASGETRSFSWIVNNVGDVQWCSGTLCTDNLDETVNELITTYPYEENNLSSVK